MRERLPSESDTLTELPAELPPKRSEFARNVGTVLTGTAFAQAIPLLVSPILTRLYTPEEFAVFAVFGAIALPLSVLSTARFEFAVMLPKEDDEAGLLVRLTLTLTLVVSLLVLAGGTLFGGTIARLAGTPALQPWAPGLAVAVGSTGAYQALVYWNSRRKRFGQVAAAAMTWQGSAAAIAIAVGLIAPHRLNGMILGFIAGPLIAALVMVALARGTLAIGIRPLPLATIKTLVRDYRQFPLYNLPYSLIGNVAAGYVVVALAAFGHGPAAAFLNQARRVMYAPVTLISGSLGQVFFQEASVSFRTARLEALTLRLLRLVGELGLPLFIFGAFWSPELFEFVYGPEWREAGEYARVFAPVAFCFLLTSWPERIYEVARRQNIALILQLISDAASIVLLVLLLKRGVPPLRAILYYSLAYTLYHATYLYIIFWIAHFSRRALARAALRLVAIGLAATAVLSALRLTAIPQGLEFVAGLVVIIGYAAIWRRAGHAEPAVGA